MAFNQTSRGTTLLSHNSSATSSGNNPANSLSLEPNPFEQSFAKNDPLTSTTSNPLTIGPEMTSNQPNGLVNNGAPQIQLPAGSPPILTPGGRRHILPPLSALSPNNINGGQQGNNINNISNPQNSHNANHLPDTPGLMWSSMMNNSADNSVYQQHPQQHHQQQHHQQQQQQQQSHQNTNTNNVSLYTQRRTGLTPNESNIRMGLTPGGTGFLAGIQLPGLNTPSSLLHTPSLTPGIGSLLDMSHINHTHGALPQTQPNNIHQHQPIVHNGTNQQPQQHQVQVPIPPTTGQQNIGSVVPTKVKREAEKVSDLPPPKKQRGRKPKPKPEVNQESHELEDGSTNDERSPSSSAHSKKNKKEPTTEEEKRKSFLERNRVAASKCRQRKKQLVNKMKEELSFYSSEHATLSSQVSTLREQVITLRTILFAHKECPSLLENVGGHATLNTILNATNYASQLPLQPTLEPTIVPHTTTIAPIEEQNKFQQELIANNNPSIATAAAVAVTTNNALNQLHQNHPHSTRKKN